VNIDKIRTNMLEKRGKNLKFKFNGARNQTEEFEGQIVGIYPTIFIIKINNSEGRIKSFTYSDVLIDNLTIID